ncbi:MAG: inositol monophosphatase, partial [Dolichospermum sp.]
TPKIWDIAAAWVIVQAAGGTWLSLNSVSFPLSPGMDYSDRCFPTMVVSNLSLVPIFTPFLSHLKL